MSVLCQSYIHKGRRHNEVKKKESFDLKCEAKKILLNIDERC